MRELGIKYMRDSEEYATLTRQVYRLAGEAVMRAANSAGGRRWAVVLDIDETTLDNSTYELERAAYELRLLEQLAEPAPELRLERRDGQEPAVLRLVDAIAGGAARQEPRHDFAGETVGDEAVRAVRHRDHDSPSLPGSTAFDQRREDLDHGGLGSRGEVGDLHGRQRRCRVCQRAGVAEVVEVVAGLLRARAVGAESGDRAQDRGRRQLDAEPLPDAGAEAFEDDVGFLQHGRRRLTARVPGEDLLAGVQRLVRPGGGVPRGVALGRLDLDHARPEALQLTGRERPGQVPRQVGDGRPG